MRQLSASFRISVASLLVVEAYPLPPSSPLSRLKCTSTCLSVCLLLGRLSVHEKRKMYETRRGKRKKRKEKERKKKKKKKEIRKEKERKKKKSRGRRAAVWRGKKDQDGLRQDRTMQGRAGQDRTGQDRVSWHC